MKEKIFLTTVILLLLTSIISGILFPSKNSYSYLNQIENFGEERSLFELVFTNNRLELKNKVDNYIFQSTVRNLSLKTMAEFSWSLQNVFSFDSQFFNTEVFYGKNGELFPKNKNCNLIKNQDDLVIDKGFEDKFIFVIIPLKQDIETNKLSGLQKNNLCTKNLINFNTFDEVNEKFNIINLYKLFEGSSKYFESGDTHWNSLGFNTVLIEMLSITNPNKSFSLKSDGTYVENNKVLERLGLIKTKIKIRKYKTSPNVENKKNILIIRDSFFENNYSPLNEIEKFYNTTFIKWGEFQSEDLYSFYRNYDFVIIESSMEEFFSNRIFYINKPD